MSHPIEPKNLIDRAIEAVAPGWARGRYQARMQIAAARGVPESSYRGAISTRTSTPWGKSTSYKGGRSRDRHDQASMRDRARTAYRDNPIARSLLNAETDAVVSDGYWVQFKSSSPAWNEEAEKRFYKWLDKADITGKAKGPELFRMTWREPRKDGDGLMILQVRGGYPRLQYIPADLITNPYKGYDPASMKDGVETDPAGRPLRFWIRDIDENGKDTVEPVDAKDVVWWSHRDDDPMSVRGTSVYATIFFILDQLDSYLDAVTKAAIMGAIFGLIERVKNPTAATSGLGTATNSEGFQQKALTLEAGMLKYVGPDGAIMQVQAQQPMAQTPDFIRALMRLAGLPFDMPLEVSMRDFSQVNFSGGQLGMKGFEQSTRVKQTWHGSGWGQIAFWWASIERKRQGIGYDDAFVEKFPDDYGEIEVSASEWLLRDRYGEAKADLLEQAIGVSSPQQACRRRNVEYKKALAERMAAWKDNETAGIPNLLSNDTRDAKLAVTAVDANGNPVGGSSKDAPDAAAETIAFKRDVVKAFLADHTVNDVIYNITDVTDLMTETGIKLDKKVLANGDQALPFLPVVADAGPLVSGAVIRDPQGDIVGGDVTNDQEPNAPTDGGGTRGGDPNGPASASPPGGNTNE